MVIRNILAGRQARSGGGSRLLIKMRDSQVPDQGERGTQFADCTWQGMELRLGVEPVHILRDGPQRNNTVELLSRSNVERPVPTNGEAPRSRGRWDGPTTFEGEGEYDGSRTRGATGRDACTDRSR